MKKILLVLAALAAVALVGGIAFVLVFMEDDPDAAFVGGSADDLQEAELMVPRNTDTDADILEALDYEVTQNKDTVAWLKIPNTRIDNSVLQSHDNLFYLRLNERRESSVYGCYFADAECNVSSRELLSHNTIVYGHSDLQDNPEGQRFSQLFKFVDPEFAKANPVIEFSTLDSFMKWEIFAVFYTTVDFDYIEAEPVGGLKQLADEAKSRSIHNYNVAVGDNDHILTLSTCSVKDGNDGTHRLVVMAKLLPDGADAPPEAKIGAQTAADAGEPAEEGAEGEQPAETDEAEQPAGTEEPTEAETPEGQQR